MTVERVPHSGAWIVSQVTGGYLVTRTYYGYTRGQAVAAFRDLIEGGAA